MSADAARDRPPSSRAGLLTCALMVALLGGAAAVWGAGVDSVSVEWIPSWNARIGLRFDGLALLYILIAAGIGLAVSVYSIRYLPLHLAETGAPAGRQRSFYGLIAMFAVSMVGLAVADDLLLLFVFWDLTAIASYLLIAFDRHKREARRAALMALLVTAVTAVLLLIGAVVLWVEHGTFSVTELAGVAGGETLGVAATGLIVVAGLAKSAQAPLHFWLPRAMIAPTPATAYLHAAAMVAAGVLLIGRVYPLIEQSRLLLDLLLGFGFASIAVGGVLALASDELKRILAYSTISQYGYVVVIYGVGGPFAAAAAAFYVFAHAIEKSALFLTVGTVGQATDCERLSELGGLARRMPGLALGSGLAAAGIAGLPLTLGFFADELFFGAALERGWAAAVAVAVAAALTVAYIGRFWLGVFAGAPRSKAGPVPASLPATVLVLGLLVGAGGLFAAPVTALAERAGEASSGVLATLAPAYHLDLRTENLLALAAWGGGLLLLAAPLRGAVAPRGGVALSRLGATVGPGALYERLLEGLNRISLWVHDVEVRDLRTRIVTVLVPAGVLAAAGVISSPFPTGYELGSFARSDLELLVAMVAVLAGAIVLTQMHRHLAMVALLAAVGYALAVVYAFFGAPDVALVAVLVETVLAVVFFAVLSLMPADVLRQEARLSARGERRWRDAAIAIVAGLFAFVIAWGALSRVPTETPVGPTYVERAGEVHARDVVTAILADFRGLDTAVEITVLAVAVLGITGLLRRGRIW